MAQRTKLQAYTDVLNAFRAGRVNPQKMSGGCLYWDIDDNGRDLSCGVGALFDEAQLNDIIVRGLNDLSVDRLIEVIGKENITHVTGLTEYELEVLQERHDRASQVSQGNQVFERFLLQEIRVHSTR